MYSQVNRKYVFFLKTFLVNVKVQVFVFMTDYVANSKQCYDEPRHTLPHNNIKKWVH